MAALGLDIAGYSMLATPAATSLPPGRPTSLILAGAMISFIVVTLNLFFFVIASCASDL